MERLALSELHATLRGLLVDRLGLLRRSTICAGYEQALRRHLDALDALIPCDDSGPLVVAADLVDLAHDGFGAAVHALCEAYRWAPDVSEADRQAALQVQAAFIPDPAELGRHHAVEAAAAIARRPQREALRDELRRLPIAGGEAIDAWVGDFLDAGERLGALASLDATTDDCICDEAYAHRGPIVRLLRQMRAGLRDELQFDPTLPRDLEQRLFDPIDEAVRRAEARHGAGPTSS